MAHNLTDDDLERILSKVVKEFTAAKPETDDRHEEEHELLRAMIMERKARTELMQYITKLVTGSAVVGFLIWLGSITLEGVARFIHHLGAQ